MNPFVILTLCMQYKFDIFQEISETHYLKEKYIIFII